MEKSLFLAIFVQLGTDIGGFSVPFKIQLVGQERTSLLEEFTWLASVL